VFIEVVAPCNQAATQPPRGRRAAVTWCHLRDLGHPRPRSADRERTRDARHATSRAPPRQNEGRLVRCTHGGPTTPIHRYPNADTTEPPEAYACQGAPKVPGVSAGKLPTILTRPRLL